MYFKSFYIIIITCLLIGCKVVAKKPSGETNLIENRIQIRSSRLSIIPPFKKYKQEKLKLKGNKWEISFNEYDHKAFKKESKRKLLKADPNIKKIEYIKVQNFNAQLIVTEGEETLIVLGFGDKQYSCYVTASVRTKDQDVLNLIQESLLSIHYDPNKLRYSLEKFNFNIDYCDSGLINAGIEGNKYSFESLNTVYNKKGDKWLKTDIVDAISEYGGNPIELLTSRIDSILTKNPHCKVIDQGIFPVEKANASFAELACTDRNGLTTNDTHIIMELNKRIAIFTINSYGDNEFEKSALLDAIKNLSLKE